MRSLALVGIVSVALLVPGCPPSAGSICQHMVDSIDGMYTRCGYHLHTVLTFDGAPSDCHHVAHVTNANQILHQCVPWADSVDCSTLEDDGAGHPVLDASCDFGLLEGRP
jgi:coenzyme F420-reducing hydrogenase gamma subunit